MSNMKRTCHNVTYVMLKIDINLQLENWYDDKSFALFKIQKR